MTDRVVAIDGPAGAGKSTVAAALAERLGMERLDTGAMYRAVTLMALRRGVDPGDAPACEALARQAKIEVGPPLVLDGEDVTQEIRSAEIDAAVSTVAAHAGVRRELVDRQRAWATEHGGGVVEGRDIGSVVFPEAELKIYLTAAPAERAVRRSAERPDGDPAGTKAAIAARDASDASRQASPLVVPADAIVVDSTGKSVAKVVEEVLARL